MLDETIDALAVLLDRYNAYCANPTADRWQRCTLTHERAIAALDNAAASHIDALIAEQIGGGNATSAKALKILEDASEEQLAVERDLAQLVGFKTTEVRDFAAEARRALRKKRPGLSPTDTAEIRTALEALRSRVLHAFETSVTESRRRKRAHRRDAAEFAQMQLWMIGAIVVNAERRSLFHISYATSVGMACVRPPYRRGLQTATCDRPVSLPHSSSEEAAAA